MNVKNRRIAQLIKRNLSDIIQFSLKDQRVGLVTVVDVEVTADMSYAKVYVNVMGDQADISERMTYLKKAKGFIRSELAQRLNTYKVPELIFILDDSLAKGNKIDAIIKELKQD